MRFVVQLVVPPLRYLLYAMALCSIASAQPGTGSLNGLVTDQMGRPVSGALVVIHADPAPYTAPSARNVYDATATSGNDGSYSFTRVPNGPYRLCAQLAGSSLVNGCLWNPSAYKVDVTGAVAPPAIVLARGATLRVRLNDPQNLLDVNEGKGTYVMVGASSPNGFVQSDPPAKTGSGREYTLVVPTGVALRPVILAPGFQISDSVGATLDAVGGSAQPVNVNDNDTERLIQVSVQSFNAKK